MRFRLLPPRSSVGWLPYSWLIYLSWFVASALLNRTSPALWAAYGVALVAFLALYFRGFWVEGTRLLPIIGGIVAIGAAFVPWNAGASSFFIYAASFAGGVGRPAVAIRWLGVVVLVLVVETLVVGLSPYTWLPGIVLSIIIGGGNIHFAERRRADQRLQLAQEEVEHLAKVAERERIARDLHDLLGHTLSLIVLKSELASKLAERDPARAAGEIRDVERISRQALTEVRHAVQGYRALTLDESIVRAREALSSAGIEMEARVTAGPVAPKVEGVLALVLREAVTNVIRHARASRCWLRLEQDAGALRLEFRDDGVGGRAASGTGLASMQARVEELGGTFERDDANGTTLRIALPAGGSAAASGLGA